MSFSLKACLHITDGPQHFLFRSSTAKVLKLVVIKIKEQGHCELQFYQNPAPATESGIRANVRMDLLICMCWEEDLCPLLPVGLGLGLGF